METVFDSAAHAPRLRGVAWRDALCDNFVHVETRLASSDAYAGSLGVADFGEVILSETTGAGQVVTRTRRHLSRVDKDCCFVQLPERGMIEMRQRGEVVRTDLSAGAVYSAAEPYRLDCVGFTRATFLEIPRALLTAALGGTDAPVTAGFSTATGMGRVLADFCRSLKGQSGRLDARARAGIGPQLVALTALALTAAGPRADETPGGLRAARLAAVKAHVEGELADPLLSLGAVARANGISLRYLHRLFEGEDASASAWIWARRLERSYEALADAPAGATVTDIAYSVGFNSSSHFSTAFRARFGLRPTEVLGLRRDAGG